MMARDQQAGIAGQTPPVNELRQTHSKGGKLIALIAGGGLVIILIGALVWVSQRNHTRADSPAAARSLPAKPTENKPPPTGQSFTEKVNGIEIQMVSVPGGTFLMGSPLSETGRDQDEGPQTEATVQNLSIDKYEVTQAQYRAVMGSNPSSFKGDDLPVDSVSWNDAVEFCKKLSQTTGRAYRLPTEAEWEYAARAKTTGPFAGDADPMTWYDANSGNRTHPVGQKAPNAFGLYDMNGNVWEWCQSKYEPYPYRADDGREDLQSTDVRVMRGGSWRSPQKGCRSAYRRRVPPDDRTIGFRIVLAAP
jgi:formylglycine-generating enzyme required for sulfatase activity